MPVIPAPGNLRPRGLGFEAKPQYASVTLPRKKKKEKERKEKTIGAMFAELRSIQGFWILMELSIREMCTILAAIFNVSEQRNEHKTVVNI